MSPTETESAVLKLFGKYKEAHDTGNVLTTPRQDMTAVELWSLLERQLQLPADTIARQIADLAQVAVHTGDIAVPEALLQRLPKKIADSFLVVPAGFEEDEPVFAIANPFDDELHENIRFLFDNRYRLVVAAPAVIEVAIASAYDAISDAGRKKQAKARLESSPGAPELDSAIPRLARQLMGQALARRASDLHLQPFVGGSVVRIRVDGLLQRVVILPVSVAESLIRYFKAQSGMDPTNNLVPQDGRMAVEIEGREYDLRLSVLPVVGRQEKLVIRFLNRQSLFKLSAIGFSLSGIHTITRMTSAPSGVILVCGPTGSGKTTTLYSILSTLNHEDTSIMTVENPVEYSMAGLSQTEVNDKAGLTFPKALRAILRQDPDILLIGEIRDEETARIAMQSALTGHLVFSTLHTNDSLSAIPRLLDLGVDPLIMSESLTGIISQRLVRKLCTKCSQPLGDHVDPAAEAFQKITRSHHACRPVGCEACNFSGFSGRTVVAELVEINQQQRELLTAGTSDISAFKAAMKGTYNSMSMVASRLVISGITTAMEAAGVIGQQFWIELAREYHSELPDLSALAMMAGTANGRAGILIAGKLDEDSATLRENLESAWFDVIEAESPVAAETALRHNEKLAFIVLELPDTAGEEQLLELYADYRKHVAWTRLPILIRIPATRPDYVNLLSEHGATARFIARSAPVGEAVELIQHAVSSSLDFKWGLINPGEAIQS